MKKIMLVGLAAMALCAVSGWAYGQIEAYGWPYVPYWVRPAESVYYTETAPYFALRVPVYYSYRVARTFGYSPYPYPPEVVAPGTYSPRPLSVQNPYAQTEGEEGSEAAQPTPPLRIDNPFVGRAEKSAKASNTTARRPQIVYPTMLARQSS
jgi:hypothetical protein